MTFYLQGLNEAQITAVTAPEGPILVLAGPGSGKTRVLTNRIVHLIREMRVPPWQIMAVTFTNKAAKEMNHRIEELLDGRPRGLTMGTFHATCARILRQESENLQGYQQDFVIFDTADQQQVVKQALKDLNLDDKKFPVNKMLNGISNAKNELITAEMYTAGNYIAEVTKRVYARYQQVLMANNAMDFDDLLMNTVLLLDQRPDVLQKYQERYRHILVDEFQDTNTAQYGLLQRLAATNRNIFAVGDSDQSIYKWRGADYRNINKFREMYPDAQMILLEQNYRSTQIILDVAKAVIKQNKNRVHKDLFTTRQGGEKITVREVYDEREEADVVLSQIQNLRLQGYSPGDMAVMYRTNAQSRVLEEAFIRAGMPYKLVGATQFYKRREVKDVIAYLRLVHNPLDSVSFARVINTPSRGIGNKTQQDLEQWAFYNSLPPSEAVVRLATDNEIQHGFNGRSFNALSNFGNMLNAWLTVRESTTVGDLLDLILEQTEYRDYIENSAKDPDEARDRWANVMELRGVALMSSELSLSEFLEQVALVSETDDLEDDPKAVTLLTLHAAKGLEFPVVFLTGLEDGVLPHSRSMEDSESMAEERRLFYVGLTRAKDILYITHAFRRTFFGQTEVAIPSRFLQDIPMNLTEGGSAKQRRETTVQQASSWSWSSGGSSSGSGGYGRSTTPSRSSKPARKSYSWADSTPTSHQPATSSRQSNLPKPRHEEDDLAPSGPQKAKYKTGQKVRHKKFGEGTVIESKLMGNDEEVSVAFAEVGVKRLAASFANLEILS
ncbi:MAG: UvrD-helicase domain-containing protein [Ardenticatenaceae bacterium]|nr:UvrD-helicase domain-containing protein [Anaerolineales bacterium]MCB8937711.1 UvrD-helicase domain-containing protein [Ardenticatenaceae bacterium]MCB8974280.1 UvrD-helicase domain-containing protein [Ardenticatenaceae bacterium]